MGINDYYQHVIKGIVLLVAVIFDSLQFMGIGQKRLNKSSAAEKRRHKKGGFIWRFLRETFFHGP
jgi:hypothetical protein